MKYTPIKCPNCSANLPTQKNNDTIYCEYCGTPYYRTKVTQNEPPKYTPPPTYIPPPTYTSSSSSSSSSSTPRTNSSTVVPPRPTINLILLVFLIMFYFVPGVIYLMHVTSRQKEWDRKYGK